MKLLYTAALIATLFLGGCGLFNRPVGYDIGICEPRGFLALHVEMGQDITVLELSPGPDRVITPEQPMVFKFVKKDQDGRHYLYKNSEIVVKTADGKEFIASMFYRGQLEGVIFGSAADGHDLANNAKNQFKTCLQLLANDQPDSGSQN